MTAKNNDLYLCRVCGLNHFPFLPWGKDGRSPSFDICECCGVEFGYEDHMLENIRQYRKHWLAGGAKWFQPELKPENWDLAKQLQQIPAQYL